MDNNVGGGESILPEIVNVAEKFEKSFNIPTDRLQGREDQPTVGTSRFHARRKLAESISEEQPSRQEPPRTYDLEFEK
jgi:hypothetical protein